MKYTEHYDNMTERNTLCDDANSKGFRMLHDNFDSDWKREDEPHGTLTFTDEPAPEAPPPEPPLVFEPPETGIPERVEYIEHYLKELQRRT